MRRSPISGMPGIPALFSLLLAASVASAAPVRQHDLCPDDPEDLDGYQDDDGCPDPDNDGDTILDIDDRCPDVAEDRDGFEDDDGCPDPDNDGDTILDARDACPLEPETWNGVADSDGCPDRGEPAIDGRTIAVPERVYFVTGQAILTPQSLPQLDAVARLLAEHRDLSRLEIQGHSDERAGSDFNLKLTRDRAEAVRRYLVERGVAASRLSARGYGASRPLCHQATDECWSRNRRVEFVILRRDGDR